MKNKYEGVIGTYSFVMSDEATIEVWSDFDNDNPDSFIFLKEGAVKSEKDFHSEISFWYLKTLVN